MRSLLQIPPIIIAFLAFQVLVIVAPHLLDREALPLLSIPMPTGTTPYIWTSDIVIGAAIVFLILQLVKNLKMRPSLLERFLSLVMVAALLVEIFFWKNAVNSASLLLLLICLINLILVFFVRPKVSGYKLDGLH